MTRCLPEKSHHATDLAGIREVYCGARERSQTEKGRQKDRLAGKTWEQRKRENKKGQREKGDRGNTVLLQAPRPPTPGGSSGSNGSR